MPDPFRPNSNAQLIREAQFAFIVIGALLCVLVYVGFQKFTGRKLHFQQISQSAPVAKHIDATQYTAQAMLNQESQAVDNFIDRVEQVAAPKTARPKKDSAIAKANFLAPLTPTKKPLPTLTSNRSRDDGKAFVPPSPNEFNDDPFEKIETNPNFPIGFSDASPVTQSPLAKTPAPSVTATQFKSDFTSAPNSPTTPSSLPEIKSNFGDGRPSEDTATQLPKLRRLLKATENQSFEAKTTRVNSPRSQPSRPIPAPPSIESSLTESSLPHPRSSNLISRASPFASAHPQPNPKRVKSFLDTSKTKSTDPIVAATDLKTDLLRKRNRVAPTSNTPVDRTSITQPDPGTSLQHLTLDDESLWSIAVEHYGDGRFFRALHQHNFDRIPDVQQLTSGVALKVPPVAELIQRYPDFCPADQVRQMQSDRQGDQSQNEQYTHYETSMEDRYHVTGSGDTLFGVARKRLGQASRYLEIFELNRFRIPENINHLTPLKPGLRLLLPQ